MILMMMPKPIDWALRQRVLPTRLLNTVKTFARYLIPQLGMILIVGLQIRYHFIFNIAPFFVFLFWVLLVTRFLGWRPALLVAFSSTLIINYYFLDPVSSLSLSQTNITITSLFWLTASCAVLMIASIQRYIEIQKVLLQREQKNFQQTQTLTIALRSALQTRDNFLAIAGHELKTPITALMLHAQSWLRRSEKHLDVWENEEVRSRLERMIAALQRLSVMINYLLDMSQLNQSLRALNQKQCDLTVIIKDVVSRYRELVHSSACFVELDLPNAVEGIWDSTRLEQVIGNLFSNALKYGSGKKVTIALQQKGGTAIIKVIDQGIGIPTDQQKRIFEPFERGSISSQFQGMGVGLWVVREILQHMGGSIEVSSEPGKGSEFTVFLACNPEIKMKKNSQVVLDLDIV